MLFHVTCKCLERKKTKIFLAVVTTIAVIAAVTGTVLLVVGSVLSTQNGKYAFLTSYVVVVEVCQCCHIQQFIAKLANLKCFQRVSGRCCLSQSCGPDSHVRRESGQIPFINLCLTRQEFLGVLIDLVTNGACGCLFWHVTVALQQKSCLSEHVQVYVHTYFIRCPAAEYVTRKPDGNLTRLSPPHVRVWPVRLCLSSDFCYKL